MIRNYQVYMKKFAHTNITSNTVETWENQVEKKKKPTKKNLPDITDKRQVFLPAVYMPL